MTLTPDEIRDVRALSGRALRKCTAELKRLILRDGVALGSEEASERGAIVAGQLAAATGQLIGQCVPCPAVAAAAACEVLVRHALESLVAAAGEVH